MIPPRLRLFGGVKSEHVKVAERALDQLKKRSSAFGLKQAYHNFSIDGVVYKLTTNHGQDIMSIVAPKPVAPERIREEAQPTEYVPTDVTVQFVEEVGHIEHLIGIARILYYPYWNIEPGNNFSPIITEAFRENLVDLPIESRAVIPLVDYCVHQIIYTSKTEESAEYKNNYGAGYRAGTFGADEMEDALYLDLEQFTVNRFVTGGLTDKTILQKPNYQLYVANKSRTGFESEIEGDDRRVSSASLLYVVHDIGSHPYVADSGVVHYFTDAYAEGGFLSFTRDEYVYEAPFNPLSDRYREALPYDMGRDEFFERMIEENGVQGIFLHASDVLTGPSGELHSLNVSEELKENVPYFSNMFGVDAVYEQSGSAWEITENNMRLQVEELAKLINTTLVGDARVRLEASGAPYEKIVNYTSELQITEEN